MIGIYLSGEALDMPPGSEITFDRVSPVFSREIGYGSQTFGFQLPDTAKNRRLLGFARLATLASNVKKFACELRVKGLPVARGTLKLEQARRTGYKVSLLVDFAPVADALGEKTLQQFSLGGLRTIATGTPASVSTAMQAHADATTSADVDTSDYVFFPVRNATQLETYSPSQTPDFYINYWHTTETFIDPVGWFSLTASLSVHSLVPFPYLRYVLEQIHSELGYVLSIEAWAAGTEMDTLVVWNNHNINTSDPSTGFPLFGGTIDLSQHVPAINAASWFKQVRELFGLIGLPKGDTVRLLSLRDIVASAQEVDWRDKVVDYEVEDEFAEGYTFGSELDSSDNLTGAAVKPAEVADLTGTVALFADLPGSPTAGDIYFVTDLNAYYLWDDTQWVFKGWGVESRTVGTAEKPEAITAEVDTPVTNYRDTWRSPDLWRVPRVETFMSGEYPGFATFENPMNARLMFYRGMTAGSPSYPLGSADTVNGAYDLSLYWTGDGNLYDTWWKTWTEARIGAKVVTFKLLLDMQELFLVEWEKRHRLRVDEGEVRGFIRKLKFNAGQGGKVLATAEVVIM